MLQPIKEHHYSPDSSADGKDACTAATLNLRWIALTPLNKRRLSHTVRRSTGVPYLRNRGAMVLEYSAGVMVRPCTAIKRT